MTELSLPLLLTVTCVLLGWLSQVVSEANESNTEQPVFPSSRLNSDVTSGGGGLASTNITDGHRKADDTAYDHRDRPNRLHAGSRQPPPPNMSGTHALNKLHPSTDMNGAPGTSHDGKSPDVDAAQSARNRQESERTWHYGQDKPILSPWPAARAPSDEERLLQLLFYTYNPSARPVMNSSKTVPVAIQFSLMHIKDLDVKSQIFTTTGLLILEWTDERLTWVPEEHNNMTEIIIEAKALWRPEFAVINGAEKIYEDYNQFRAVISSEGHVHWEPGGVFKTMCEIDITFYPFDEQRCVLTFGAWSYHTSKMNLTNMKTIINLDSYSTNGEWHVYNTWVKRNEFSYECCPHERFANVDFNIYLRRRHTFYILNVILPSIMTSVLLLSIFFCTPGQKVQIGVVVLLSFRIFLLNVSGNIPKTSDYIPLLGIYLTCTMAITTLSMVLTVFVLNLHHISDRPVPGWAKRCVFVYLARVLGMCGTAASETKRERKKLRPMHARCAHNPGGFFRRGSGLLVRAHGLEDGDETTAIIEMQNRRQGAPNNAGSGNDQRPANLANSDHCYTAFIQSNAHAQYEKEPPPSQQPANRSAQDTEKDEEDYSKEWRRIAEVLDRLFFWLFLFAILISTLVLFHPLTRTVTGFDADSKKFHTNNSSSST